MDREAVDAVAVVAVADVVATAVAVAVAEVAHAATEQRRPTLMPSHERQVLSHSECEGQPETTISSPDVFSKEFNTIPVFSLFSLSLLACFSSHLL
jgi:hypothetical protein